MGNRTLKQIAEELGISVSTVSRAINGKSVVKEIDRVVSGSGYLLIPAATHEKAAKEHQYLQMIYTHRVDALVDLFQALLPAPRSRALL